MVSNQLKVKISESAPMKKNVSGYDSQDCAEFNGHVTEQS
jgi:hypothetical protein